MFVYSFVRSRLCETRACVCVHACVVHAQALAYLASCVSKYVRAAVSACVYLECSSYGKEVKKVYVLL